MLASVVAVSDKIDWARDTLTLTASEAKGEVFIENELWAVVTMC